VLWGLFLLYNARAEHETAQGLAEQCLSLAQRLDDLALLLEAHLPLGTSCFYLGQLPQAHAHFEQDMRLYNPQQHHALAFRYGNIDPGAACLAFAGCTLWLLGYPDQALERVNEALTLAQHLEHPYTLARVLYWTTLLHQLRREWQEVSERTATALTVATAQQIALVLALGPIHARLGAGHAGAGGRGPDAAPPGAGRLSGHRRRILAAAFLEHAGRGAQHHGAARGRRDGAARGPDPGRADR
jgi:tetratricopeptide (TPR) repeat protein